MQKTAFWLRQCNPLPKTWAQHRRTITKTLFVIKLTTLLLTAALVHVHAAGLTQTLSFSGKDVPLKTVFSAIERQTGYVVFYNKSDLNNTTPVTLSVKNLPLNTFLETVLKGQPLSFLIRDKTIVLTYQPVTDEKHSNPAPADLAPADPRPLKGMIVDHDGKPIAGATIWVKGTNRATFTDKNGNFTIPVQLGEKIVFSSIGFAQREHIVKGYDIIVITMEINLSHLDEIQVVAYGTTTKRFSTGSVSTVKSDVIERQPVSNVLAAIQGRVPGMQISQTTGLPGGNYTVQLRGQNSLTGNSAPLYIIDGIPFTATSLTKLNDKNAAGFSNPLNNINPLDIESISVLKDAAATSIYGARGANGVILITMKKGKAGDTRGDINAYTGFGRDTRRFDMMNTSQYLALRREALANAGTTPTIINAPDLLSWDTTKNTDWQKQFLGGTARYNNVQGSVSGGTGNTTFLLGAGYSDESTVFSSRQLDRKISAHFSINHHSANGRFQALLTGSYINDHLGLPLLDFTSIMPAPNTPPFVQDGKLIFYGSNLNPLVSLYRPYLSVTDNLITNASLSYSILPGLQFKVNTGFISLASNETQVSPLSTFSPAVTTASSSSSFANNSIKTWNVEPQITYGNKIGNGMLNVLVGATIQSSFSHGVRYNATGFLTDAFLYNITAAKTVVADPNYFTDVNTKDNSFFGRIGYIYNEKYIAELTGRRDGSSRFGPGKQFGNFGAAGLGWIFSKENLVSKALPFLSFGKLRLSYGTVGNSPGSDYAYLSKWSITTYAYDNLQGLYPTGIPVPDFAWETTRKLEGGLDLELLKGRIAVSADYYRNRSSNQLVQYPLPTITGFSGVLANLDATVQNTGWEFSLQTTNIRTKNFEWTSGFTFSAARNKLIAFPNLDASPYAYNFVIGAPIYIQKLYHYVDVDPQTGVYRFAGKSGPTSSPNSVTDLNVAFDPKPRYYGGLDNSLRYKGFELNFYFLYTKQKTFNTGPSAGGISNVPKYYIDHWRKPGDISNIQIINPNFGAWTFADAYASQSDRTITDASFIRLKNVSFAYNLPAAYMKKAHLKSARVYFQGQNLLTITSFKGLDPETGNKNLPPLRVLTFGLQLGL